MRARKYRVASNDTVLSATRYGPYARLSRIISCRYTVVITDFSVSPYSIEKPQNKDMHRHNATLAITITMARV